MIVPPESIVAVAHRLPSGKVRSLPRPARYHHLPREVLAVPGFLTSEGRFVTQEEARGIAERAGQIREGADVGRWLYSQDVW